MTFIERSEQVKPACKTGNSEGGREERERERPDTGILVPTFSGGFSSSSQLCQGPPLLALVTTLPASPLFWP